MLAIRTVGWLEDKETGYKIPVIPTSYPSIEDQGDGRLKFDGLNLALCFTPDLKKKFIETFRKSWPNPNPALDAAGVTHQTYNAHLAIDDKFRSDVEEIVNRGVNEIEGRFWEFGKRPKNYMDRITIARAYRGEIYNPKGTLDVNVRDEMSDAEAGEIASRAGKVVDAEIVREQYFRKPTAEIPGAVGIQGDESVNRKDVPADGGRK